MTTKEEIKISLLTIKDYFKQSTLPGAVAVYNLLYTKTGRDPVTLQEAESISGTNFFK